MLPLHEDELDVVLHNRVRLEWLAEEASSVFHLVDGIRDLVPDDRCDVLEPDHAAMLLNRSMQRDNRVPAVILSPREADVADNDDESAARDQYSLAMRPDFVELGEETVVVFDVAQLPVGL